MHPGRGEILDADIFVSRVRAKKKDGARLAMLKAPIAICAAFGKMKIKKKATKLAEAHRTRFHGLTSATSEDRIAEFPKLADGISVEEVDPRNTHCQRRSGRRSQ